MKSFEEQVARDSEGTPLGTKLAVLACVAVILMVVTFLGLRAEYVDVEQAGHQVSEVTPTAVAVDDTKSGL